MASRTNEILERIAAIQITIEVTGAPRPNVLMAEPYQPSDTNSARCPFFINELHGGPARIPISAGQQYVEEDIHMVLCVRRKEAGTNLKLGVKEIVMWRDAVLAAFAQRVKLSNPANDSLPGNSHVGLSFVVDGEIKNWEAIEYVYGANEYLALMFVFHVNEMYVTTINE